jgi:hypothetical protein
MADSVYGPYTYAGSVVDTAAIAPAFRMNDTAGPWYSHQDYADRHGSFWAAGGQWFFSANDRSHSTDLAHRDVFRDTIFAYVHFYPNGTIAPVVIDETGVGEAPSVARPIEERRVLLDVGVDAHGLRLTVEDNGRGILPEVLPRVFDPFYSTKTRGTGLGLALVHRIVEEHGGTVSVDSEPGLGATFTVWLPPPARAPVQPELSPADSLQ